MQFQVLQSLSDCCLIFKQFIQPNRSTIVPDYPIDLNAVLQSLPDPLLVVDRDGHIHYVNFAAQAFFNSSQSHFLRDKITSFVPTTSPILGLIEQVFISGNSLSGYDIDLETPRTGYQSLTIQVSPMGEPVNFVTVTMVDRSMARKIDQRLSQSKTSRSMNAMARTLAHEIKNPLLSIRGASQLLENSLNQADQELTRLIRDESDRIKYLVERVELLADHSPVERETLNIHEVLDHTRRAAIAGFARDIRFVERYDPSLPEIEGHRDLLIQIFLNLIKNAAEAVPVATGEIILTTSYRPGVRMVLPGLESRVHLPLQISIQDNGSGIPDDMKQHLFDPFMTSKTQGTGLGLALVSKLVGDHGGVIDVESDPGRTIFTVSLPVRRTL
jgi:two-component system nitrogen regulation sensor histidine kinase GlnL